MGNGANEIQVDADDFIGIVTVAAGDGGNAIDVEAHEVNITTGSAADVIKAEGDIIKIASGGGGDTITVIGYDYDYVGTDELGGNVDPATSIDNPGWGDDGALVQIDTGTGSATVILGSNGIDYVTEADNEFPGPGSITAHEGSFITGEDVSLFVNTVADLRAAELTNVTRVVIDDDAFDINDAPQANNAEGGINAAVLTLTDTPVCGHRCRRI